MINNNIITLITKIIIYIVFILFDGIFVVAFPLKVRSFVLIVLICASAFDVDVIVGVIKVVDIRVLALIGFLEEELISTVVIVEENDFDVVGIIAVEESVVKYKD